MTCIHLFFCYENTTKHQFEHITRVEYSSFGKQTIVSENELLSHHFPTRSEEHTSELQSH